MSWALFSTWINVFLGLLWLQRNFRGSFRCNPFSAAIAAAFFVVMNDKFLALTVNIDQQPDYIFIPFVLFIFTLYIPSLSGLTLFVGDKLIPTFKFKSQMLRCAVYLAAWVLIFQAILDLLKFLGLLVLAGAGGRGMPRIRSYDGRYYY